MFEDLKGRVALVTGGATGIGGAISAAFGAAGMKVAVHYHAGSEAAQGVAEQVRRAGGEALLLQSDITEAKAADEKAAVERTKTAPWGLEGGGEARPNGAAITLPGGSRREFGKATRLLVPKGATLELYTGGGGGYGPPSARDNAAVLHDLREGYITEAHAQAHYPEAFAG